jgi:phenylpropionate dioxygenase-like ring-hydroxylating dioxygenase large terminal subunit
MGLYPPPADSSFDIGDGPRIPDPDIMETGRVPVAAYTSPERFDLELEIFNRVWLNAGRVEEVPNAGDWIVRDMDFRPVSILVVRGKDMQIRAFYNMCAHRGMKLVWESKGRGGKFSCPYHAWNFNAAGELTGIPDETCFPYVNKRESGLTPIACDIWEGFIFINLDKNPKQSLVDYLGPVAEKLKGAPFGDYPLTVTMSQEVEANWKLGIEAASEGYHVQALHTQSVGRMLASKENPHVNFLAWEALGPHRSGLVPRNTEYRLPDSRPVQKFAFSSAGQMMVEGEAGEDKQKTGFLGHPGINKLNSPVFQNEQIMIFPNFSTHIGINGWWSTSYWPLSLGRAFWRTVFYYKRPKSLREKFAIHYAIGLQRDIFTEDNGCFQKQYKMFQSGGKPFIQFGEGEMLCRHLVAVITGIADQRTPTENRRIAAE